MEEHCLYVQMVDKKRGKKCRKESWWKCVNAIGANSVGKFDRIQSVSIIEYSQSVWSDTANQWYWLVTWVFNASFGLKSSSSWLIAMKSPTGSSESPLTTCTSTLITEEEGREEGRKVWRKEGRKERIWDDDKKQGTHCWSAGVCLVMDQSVFKINVLFCSASDR